MCTAITKHFDTLTIHNIDVKPNLVNQSCICLLIRARSRAGGRRAHNMEETGKTGGWYQDIRERLKLKPARRECWDKDLVSIITVL